MLPGITDTIRNLGIPLVDDLGWKFRIVTVVSLTTGTLFLMWLGGSNYRARNWQRNFAHHHYWYSRAFARSPGTGLEDLCALSANGNKSGQPGRSRAHGRVPVHCHRWGDRDHPRRAKDYCAIRQARRWAQNVRWPNAVHAFESELRRRDANHFRLGAASLSRRRLSARI